VSDGRFELVISPTARRQLTDKLPESVAFAAYEFIIGPLLDNPHRVGKRLGPPLADRHSARRGTYRVIYRIDEPRHTVTVVAVVHLADVTRNGRRTALLLSADDYDTLQETIAALSDAELLAAHRDGQAAIDADDYLDANQLAQAMREAGRLPR
jgi:Cytotoxic translational repressor of toxin-antitoxin stability system